MNRARDHPDYGIACATGHCSNHANMCHTKLPPWALLPLALALGFPSAMRADPIITEFLAANTKTNADNDGAFSDWIELFNPDATPANLAGWYLTDNAALKTKWQFPAVTLPAGGYLIVWASNENRRDPAKPLHTNFALSAEGGYLALIKPDGTTAATEFAPAYPPQLVDVSYGVTQPTGSGEESTRSFFRTPTPNARNGGPNTILLTERVVFSRPSGPFTDTITVTLSGATAGQRIRYVIAPPTTTGATVPEPGPTATIYTGPITVSASSIVRAMIYGADNLATGFPATAHYVRLATTGSARLDTFSSQLPLMVIDTHGTGPLVKSDNLRPGWIYTWPRPATGNTAMTVPPTALSSITTNVRGASSAEFPKKSFTLRLDDTLGRDNPLPLYGLPSFENWTLIGPWNYDRTFLNNAFIYALSNRLGRWAPRTQMVELFFNANGGDLDQSDYVGIYILTDSLRIDSKRVDLAKLAPNDLGAKKITGGYLLKLDLPDSNEFNFQLRRGFPGLPFALGVSQPKLADLHPSQRDYISNYFQQFDDALTANLASGWKDRTHLDYIDRASWVDHHIMNVLGMNVDGLVRSTYMTKDREGRLQAGPVWDFDRALGGGDPRSQNHEVWQGDNGATDFWNYGWWGLLAQDPEFLQAWVDRWQLLRRTELSATSLATLVDSLAAQIGPAAAARDAARWPDNAPRFGGSWQGEIDALKSWLARRALWIDNHFAAAPTVVAGAGTLVVTPAPGTQLAYTTDGTDPRAFGGLLAHAVRLSATAVTVPATANLQARSYRPNFTTTDGPATTWSSAVSGARSSPLAPRPRLANLSSRGFIGSDENILIVGVVVNDTAGKQYLARAVGPALTGFGVAGALAQPVLRILDSRGRELARNSAWETGPDADDIADLTKFVGAFPFAKGSKDAALLARLPAGQFTLQISSATTGTGVGLAELYEIDPGIGRTLNLSTRGLVRGGDEVLIGGVVVRGPGPKRLLIRAIGPTLGGFGVAGTLADPVLTLFDKASVQVATNDDWSTRGSAGATTIEVAAATAAVGGFALPSDSKDAVLLLTLAEGPYTAQITGKAGASGVILFEIYEVP